MYIMKKWILTLLVAITGLNVCFAKEIDAETAKKTAVNFYFRQQNLFDEKIDIKDVVVKNIIEEKRNNVTLAYIVEMQNDGMVVVSADDAMMPVLAFIEHGDAQVIVNGNPEFKYMYEGYLNMVENIRNKNIAQSPEISREWKALLTDDSETLLNCKSKEEVGPLLKTIWNQSSPYNHYCPPIAQGSNALCPAGCVATAMSVIMEYYRWPLRGKGSSAYFAQYGGYLSANYDTTYYNWNAMPAPELKLNADEESIYAVALLQYHAGISVQMNYEPDGSGANSWAVPSALQQHFRFSDDCHLEDRMYYSTPEWEQMMRDEISSGRVLYYSGFESGQWSGHAWNCDGYRMQDGVYYFHHNFNWGGQGNGWFVSSNPGEFNTGHQMVLDAVPGDEYQYPYYDSGLTVVKCLEGRIVDGSGPIDDYQPTEAAWLINPADKAGDSVEYITLWWESFDLADGDYVRIYDGENENAALLGEYTGHELPDTIQSSGDKLYVTFNATHGDKGFAFNYIAKTPVYCKGLVTLTDNPCTISFAPEGKFYRPGMFCRYVVDYGDKGVKVVFNNMDTYDKNDNVQVFDMKTEALYGPFFGNTIPDAIITEGPAMIVFKTDHFNHDNYGCNITCTLYDGMENCTESDRVEIYPNPTNGKLTIINNVKEGNIDKIYVYDNLGKIVDRYDVKDVDGSRYEVDLSGRDGGVYFVKLIYDDRIITRKIIVK